LISGIAIKVCGLTSLADAECAARCGADYFGFNLYPKSPRFISLEKCSAIASPVLSGKRVAVMVEPSMLELEQATKAGFDYFQVHFRHDFPFASLAAWSGAVGASHLWLAPKLPPEIDVDSSWLPLASLFVLDTFQAESFGGSGRTGDWSKFSKHRKAHPTKHWMLAGGLKPDNVAEALRESGARFVDVNSGVESSPGVKDPGKLEALAAAIRHRQ
jgi:phosphoribosylanthranilate isomerase